MAREREDVARGDRGQRRVVRRGDAGGVAAGRPLDVGQAAPRRPDAGQPALDLGDEGRGAVRVALLVGGAGDEHERVGGARRGRVEEVGLLGLAVLLAAQHDPGLGQRPARVVGQERLGPRRPREGLRLQAGDDHRAKAPRADADRVGDQHRARADRLGVADLDPGQGGEDVLRLDAAPELGQLVERAPDGAERERVEPLVLPEHRRPLAPGPDEQPARPRARGRRATRGTGGLSPRSREAVERVEREVPRLLPEPPRLGHAGDRRAAAVGLERVGALGLVEHAGRAQPGQQVGDGGVGRERRAGQPEQAAAERGVGQRDLPGAGGGDPRGAEHALEQRARPRGASAGRRRSRRERSPARAGAGSRARPPRRPPRAPAAGTTRTAPPAGTRSTPGSSSNNRRSSVWRASRASSA